MQTAERGNPIRIGRPPGAPSYAPSYRRFEHHALGTVNLLSLADADPRRPEDTDAAAAAAFHLLDRLEDQLSRFRSESEVSLLNTLGFERPIAVGKALFELLQAAKSAWEETAGVFDPTIGPLMDAWGFPRGPARVPPADEIEDLLTARGMDLVDLDAKARTARFARRGVAIDLGSIGKGYAVDRAAELLRGRGIPAGAVISGTSTLKFWGEPPGGGPWQVEVAHPERPEEAIAVLEAAAGSVSTSGAYQDRFFHEGIEYGHILDPRTGRPARGKVRSATVWTEDALRGDILSTAIYVLGASEGARLVANEARASALVVEVDPASWGGLSVRTFHGQTPGFKVLRTA